MSDLKTGDLAPHFRLATDGGGEADLGELRGRTIVLYFYPKDDTPGSKASAEFGQAGAVIIGVSKDSVKKHDKFKAKHELTVILASDEDGSTVEAYGSWVLKKLYGREYMGIDRSTFLIGPDGRLNRIWHKVKLKGHVDEVLAAARELAD
jgi:peroxiredoxin Q/BCP